MNVNELVQLLDFNFRPKFARRELGNIFFLGQLSFDGNMLRTYVAKVFFVGISLLGRRDWAVENCKKTVECQSKERFRKLTS